MKIGWLLYTTDYGRRECVEFYTEKPEYYSGELVQIVYTEVIPHANT